MAKLTPGKMRGIDQLATDEGVIAVLAIDHRDSLKAVLDADVTDEEITQFKLDLIAGVGPQASGVMLEPEFSLPQAIEAGVVKGSQGFMAALEAQGYMQDPWAGPTVVAEVAAACAELDLALLVEPVAFGMADEARPQTVLDTVTQLTDLPIDVMKVEFPGEFSNPAGWADACAAVDAACNQPWVLLSSGVTFEQYRDQLDVAFDNGCSGFTGGRAIWRPASDASPEMRNEIIATVVAERFSELRALAVEKATPWRAV